MTIDDIILGNVYACKWGLNDTIYFNVYTKYDKDHRSLIGRCILAENEVRSEECGVDDDMLKHAAFVDNLGPQETFTNNYPEYFV